MENKDGPIRRSAGSAGRPQEKEALARASLSFTPEEVEKAHRDLTEAFSRGWMDKRRYLAICNAMKFTDEYGRIWAIGMRSGNWYYNVNFRWFEGEPHSLLQRLESALPTCLHCGDNALSRRALYCISCGMPLHSLPSAETIRPPSQKAAVGGDKPRRFLLLLVLLAALALALLTFLLLRGGWPMGVAALGWMLPADFTLLTAERHRRSGT